MKDCIDNQVQNAWSIPYFEGDFWSNIIEESIKGMFASLRVKLNIVEMICHSELDQEEEDRRKQEVEAARAMEDGGLDDLIEPEDHTDVCKMFKLFACQCISFRHLINVNLLRHIKRKI